MQKNHQKITNDPKIQKKDFCFEKHLGSNRWALVLELECVIRILDSDCILVLSCFVFEVVITTSPLGSCGLLIWSWRYIIYLAGWIENFLSWLILVSESFHFQLNALRDTDVVRYKI